MATTRRRQSLASTARAVLALVAVITACRSPIVVADPRTVCTVTVNSADERETFRRYLPVEEYRFVELVERGRPDWLGSACRQGVRCDMLIISGHFDSGTEFYSDRLDMRESLPVAELERASCSESCPGLFAQLKEVYLFGCNTLNAEATASASPEVPRSLIRAGHSPAEAERLTRALERSHGESSRDRMRRIFVAVPAIYGFSAMAPLGPAAASTLSRYFEAAGTTSVGSGRSNPRLVNQFAGNAMTWTSGLEAADSQVAYRQDVCRFVDDRLAPAGKVDFLHDLLRRDMAEVRMFLDRIEALLASMNATERLDPQVARAFEAIAGDRRARDRYLDFADDADRPQIRARMIRLAGMLGWLTPEEQRIELVRMVGDLMARNAVGAPEVELICTLNGQDDLARDRHRLRPTALQAGMVGNAAALACLGSAPGRSRVLSAMTSQDDDEAQIAQVYLAHRPITDGEELRVLAHGIQRMNGSGARVRALDTLARQRLDDRQILGELARLFTVAGTLEVQRAIAAVLIRADSRAIAKPEVARLLSQHRLKSPDGEDIIDILIRRLRTS